jgi:predicted ATPase/DNA-binding winged helix-turn-helix (wHTH) protein
MIFGFSGFEVDEELFELRRHGTTIAVQRKVLELLLLLVREAPRVVQKRELFEKVWPDSVVSEAALARVAMEARRAIGDSEQQIIVTVRGRGLRFARDVTVRAGAVAASTSPLTAAEEDGLTRARPSADPYVGREVADAALRARIDAARAGSGSLVWLSGDAGIGKTRTIEEFAALAKEQGATVLTGRSHELADVPPYWPWLQIARAFAASLPVTESKAFVRAARELLPDLAPRPDEEKTAPGEGSSSGPSIFRLYDALTQRLVDAARAQPPLVLILEDMQWADDPSLELLRFFVRESRAAPVLVVASYRDTTLGPGPRSRALGTLLTEHANHLLPLRALTEGDVARLVEARTGRAPSAAFSAKLHEKSGGNPQYVQHILKTEWASREQARAQGEIRSSIDLEHGLLQAIARRLESISTECRATLSIAAVLGATFELPLLSAVATVTTETLLDRLEEGVRARILVKASVARYAFMHALVRDVLYQRLTVGERVAHHRAVADALLARESFDSHMGEIAIHLVRAAPSGDAERAVGFAVRAGEEAWARGASMEAAAHFERALEALRFVPGEHEERASELRGRTDAARAAHGGAKR